MKIKQPEPFLFEAGSRAVLLLHGFTGHSADVRMLGRFLEKKGYTSYAPIYRGHGLTPGDLVKTSPEDWWEDAQKAFQFLQEKGYQEIAVAGLSMGAVFSLKLALEQKVKAVIPMCAPMIFDNKHRLEKAFHYYAIHFKKSEGKDEATIEIEIESLMKETTTIFQLIAISNEQLRDRINEITSPILIAQARKDVVINPESANYLYDHVQSEQKKLIWYEQSGHVVTIGPEKEQLHEDIYTFLQSLNWEQ